jgi:hypothetical protein
MNSYLSLNLQASGTNPFNQISFVFLTKEQYQWQACFSFYDEEVFFRILNKIGNLENRNFINHLKMEKNMFTLLKNKKHLSGLFIVLLMALLAAMTNEETLKIHNKINIGDGVQR